MAERWYLRRHTAGGTRIAADPWPGLSLDNQTWPLGVLGTSLLFAANDTVSGIEPCVLPLTTPIGPPPVGPPVVVNSGGTPSGP